MRGEHGTYETLATLLNNTNPIKIPEHPFYRQSTGFKFTPTKRRLSTSHIPVLEPVLKPALLSCTNYSDSLLPSINDILWASPHPELREFLRYTYF